MNFVAAVQRQINPWVAKLLSDSDLSTTVTYKLWESEEYDELLKYNVVSYTECLGLKAMEIVLDKEEYIDLPGSLQKGDHIFIFSSLDLPDSISLKDIILSGLDTEFEIEKIVPVYSMVTIIKVKGSL